MLPLPPHPPAANGTLAKTPLVHLFVYAEERRLTGTLVFEEPTGHQHAIYVHHGAPAKVFFERPELTLGCTIADAGYLPHEAAETHYAQAKQAGLLLGAWLVQQGIVDAATRDSLLAEHVERKFSQVALMDDATTFAFYDAVDLLQQYADGRNHPTDPLALIWAGVRQRPPWEHISVTLARVGNSGLKLSPNASPERFRFGKSELTLVSRLAASEGMRLADLSALRVLGANAVQLVAYALLITKQVDLIELTAAPPASLRSAPPPAAAPVQPRMAPTPSPEPVAAAPRSLPPIAQAAQGYAAPQIRHVAPIANPVANPAPIPHRAPQVAAQAAPASSSAGSALSAEDLAFRDEIEAKAKTAGALDYFAMLGVAHDATAEVINKAYFDLARRWHPDRLPAGLAPQRDLAAKVFSYIAAAHKTLGDSKKRADYMHLLKDGGASPDDQAQIQQVLEAVVMYQKAEFFFKRRDMAQAEQFARQAAQADPGQADYAALHIWINANKAENQGVETTRSSIEELNKALAVNARCVQALFYRGMLFKRIGQGRDAYKSFKMCVELQPEHVDAAREVRLHAMRGGRSIPPPMSDGTSAPPPSVRGGSSGGGLFDKFFKK